HSVPSAAHSHVLVVDRVRTDPTHEQSVCCGSLEYLNRRESSRAQPSSARHDHLRSRFEKLQKCWFWVNGNAHAGCLEHRQVEGIVAEGRQQRNSWSQPRGGGDLVFGVR